MKKIIIACLFVVMSFGALANGDSRYDRQQLDCLARAVYYEARGESERGMRGVAHVIINRAGNPSFPSSVCAVINERRGARCQFSFVCEGKMERRITASDPMWTYAQRIARVAYFGAPDPTNGALYFHARRVRPSWRHAFEEVAEDFGNHRFYRERE